MEKVTLTVDGKTILAEPGLSILEAALRNGVYIPHLCGHESLMPAGACGMCAVKVKDTDGITLACSTRISEGMEVDTRDETAEKVRKLACDLLFKTHPSECTNCPKYGKCQLQTISQYVGDTGRELRESKLPVAADNKNPVIMHEMYRCILCGRCVRVCTDVRGVGAIRFKKVNGRTRIVVDGDDLSDAGCRFCSACVDVCPTGSIREHEAIAARTAGKPRDAALVPCRDSCPAHIDVPRYIRHISKGEYEAAASVIKEKAPFPYVLGHICDHPCEAECKRGHLNESMGIRGLKRFAAQAAQKIAAQAAQKIAAQAAQKIAAQAAQKIAAPPSPESVKKRTTCKRVAVIGAGPAGLTSAYLLAGKGHDVTVFEANEKAGGMLRYGIPRHRLPRAVLDSEISETLGADLTLATGTRVENAPSLLDKGFDAVLAAVGAHLGVKLPLPGADMDGVFLGTDFLRAAENNAAPDVAGLRIMVLGGGNVAFDCAAVARRLGAAETHIACLEAYASMTSSEEERKWALEEGAEIHDSKTFLEIAGDNGRVSGVRLASVSGFHFDENGRGIVDVIPDSEKLIEADAVIFAIGQRPEIDSTFGLDLSRGGRIAVTDGCVTGTPGVFATGDAVTGTASVIKAIAAARCAAESIDLFLGGDGEFSVSDAGACKGDPHLGKQPGFGKLERCSGNILPPAERTVGFVEMDPGLSEEQALNESVRCLQCDLRLDIAAQRFWTDYTDRGN